MDVLKISSEFLFEVSTPSHEHFELCAAYRTFFRCWPKAAFCSRLLWTGHLKRLTGGLKNSTSRIPTILQVYTWTCYGKPSSPAQHHFSRFCVLRSAAESWKPTKWSKSVEMEIAHEIECHVCHVLRQTSGATASEAIFQQPRKELCHVNPHTVLEVFVYYVFFFNLVTPLSHWIIPWFIMIVLSCYVMLSIDVATLSNMHAAILRLPPPSSLNVCFLQRQQFLLTVARCYESCTLEVMIVMDHGQNTSLTLHVLTQIKILIDVAKAKLIARRDVQYLAALTNQCGLECARFVCFEFWSYILRSFFIILCFLFWCGTSSVAMPVCRIKPSSFLVASLPLPSSVGPTSSL